MTETSEACNVREKERIAEELSPFRDTPSPMSSALEEASDGEHRPAQSHASSVEGIALYPEGVFGSPYPKTRV